jgi:tRNA pseudouridine55 synthase
MNPIKMNGTILINKPEGWTSHDVVAKLRGILKTRRIGHAGTLDPFATGLLVVCVGTATRLVQFLVGLEKEYVATVRLGYATDTQDLTGKPISTLVPSNDLTVQQIAQVLEDFRGEQLQLPPMFSAKKVGGERLHKAARAGREVERPAVKITIDSIALLNEAVIVDNADGTRDFAMRVRCSSGTYIRTLAHDIGARLGVGAHLSALHRTTVGQFGIAAAISLSEVEAKKNDNSIVANVIGLAETVAHLQKVLADAERLKFIAHGREIVLSKDETRAFTETIDSRQSQAVRLCDKDNELAAIGEYIESRQAIQPKVVFLSAAN